MKKRPPQMRWPLMFARPPKKGFFVLPASNFRLGHTQIQIVSGAIAATFAGPLPPSHQFRRAYGRFLWTVWCRFAFPCDRQSHPICSRPKHSQTSAPRAHPDRGLHPQAGLRVYLMQRHQLLLTGPLLLAPVPQGLKMRTHRCTIRSRLVKFV